MGVFDQNSLKFNDVEPKHIDKDGVEWIKCDNTKCNCRDNNGCCLYETCIFKMYNKIKYHCTFTHNCEICGDEFTKEISDSYDIPMMDLSYHICPGCKQGLLKILKG